MPVLQIPLGTRNFYVGAGESDSGPPCLYSKFAHPTDTSPSPSLELYSDSMALDEKLEESYLGYLSRTQKDQNCKLPIEFYPRLQV